MLLDGLPSIPQGHFSSAVSTSSGGVWDTLRHSLRVEAACRNAGFSAPDARSMGRPTFGHSFSPEARLRQVLEGLSGVHKLRVRSWNFCVWVSFLRPLGKVRAVVRPRCCCNSKSPSSKFLNVAMRSAPWRPLILDASSPRLTSRR